MGLQPGNGFVEEEEDIPQTMRTATEGAQLGAPSLEIPADGRSSHAMLKDIVHWLDEAKAEKLVTIDLKGKSSIGDFMVIATGGSDRHVGAIAEQLRRKIKEAGADHVRVEGLDTCDWVLVDTGDIIIHIFRAEVREFYNLEKMWSGERPADQTAH
ncbi:MAG: ribosome silencing factor [Hyphomicrobiaceae bacterium]|jgi:ribosome-associated protein|nr:ribosome silencing factor [Hyphomicrobiaceae bacterium]